MDAAEHSQIISLLSLTLDGISLSEPSDLFLQNMERVTENEKRQLLFRIQLQFLVLKQLRVLLGVVSLLALNAFGDLIHPT